MLSFDALGRQPLGLDQQTGIIVSTLSVTSTSSVSSSSAQAVARAFSVTSSSATVLGNRLTNKLAAVSSITASLRNYVMQHLLFITSATATSKPSNTNNKSLSASVASVLVIARTLPVVRAIASTTAATLASTTIVRAGAFAVAVSSMISAPRAMAAMRAVAATGTVSAPRAMAAMRVVAGHTVITFGFAAASVRAFSVAASSSVSGFTAAKIAYVFSVATSSAVSVSLATAAMRAVAGNTVAALIAIKHRFGSVDLTLSVVVSSAVSAPQRAITKSIEIASSSVAAVVKFVAKVISITSVSSSVEFQQLSILARFARHVFGAATLARITGKSTRSDLTGDINNDGLGGKQ